MFWDEGWPRGRGWNVVLRFLWGCFLCRVVVILKWEFRAQREDWRKGVGVLIGCETACVWIRFGRDGELRTRIGFMPGILLCIVLFQWTVGE